LKPVISVAPGSRLYVTNERSGDLSVIDRHRDPFGLTSHGG